MVNLLIKLVWTGPIYFPFIVIFHSCTKSILSRKCIQWLYLVQNLINYEEHSITYFLMLQVRIQQVFTKELLLFIRTLWIGRFIGWCHEFSGGRTNVKMNKWIVDHIFILNYEHLQRTEEAIQHVTIRELHKIILKVFKTILWSRKLCACWVPKTLTEEKTKLTGFIYNFLTYYAQIGDEIWTYHHMLESKQQSMKSVSYAFCKTKKLKTHFKFKKKKNGNCIVGQKKALF